MEQKVYDFLILINQLKTITSNLYSETNELLDRWNNADDLQKLDLMRNIQNNADKMLLLIKK